MEKIPVAGGWRTEVTDGFLGLARGRRIAGNARQFRVLWTAAGGQPRIHVVARGSSEIAGVIVPIAGVVPAYNIIAGESMVATDALVRFVELAGFYAGRCAVNGLIVAIVHFVVVHT